MDQTQMDNLGAHHFYQFGRDHLRVPLLLQVSLSVPVVKMMDLACFFNVERWDWPGWSVLQWIQANHRRLNIFGRIFLLILLSGGTTELERYHQGYYIVSWWWWEVYEALGATSEEDVQGHGHLVVKHLSENLCFMCSGVVEGWVKNSF